MPSDGGRDPVAHTSLPQAVTLLGDSPEIPVADGVPLTTEGLTTTAVDALGLGDDDLGDGEKVLRDLVLDHVKGSEQFGKVKEQVEIYYNQAQNLWFKGSSAGIALGILAVAAVGLFALVDPFHAIDFRGIAPMTLVLTAIMLCEFLHERLTYLTDNNLQYQENPAGGFLCQPRTWIFAWVWIPMAIASGDYWATLRIVAEMLLDATVVFFSFVTHWDLDRFVTFYCTNDPSQVVVRPHPIPYCNLTGVFDEALNQTVFPPELNNFTNRSDCWNLGVEYGNGTEIYPCVDIVLGSGNPFRGTCDPPVDGNSTSAGNNTDGCIIPRVCAWNPPTNNGPESEWKDLMYERLTESGIITKEMLSNLTVTGMNLTDFAPNSNALADLAPVGCPLIDAASYGSLLVAVGLTAMSAAAVFCLLGKIMCKQQPLKDTPAVQRGKRIFNVVNKVKGIKDALDGPDGPKSTHVQGHNFGQSHDIRAQLVFVSGNTHVYTSGKSFGGADMLEHMQQGRNEAVKEFAGATDEDAVDHYMKEAAELAETTGFTQMQAFMEDIKGKLTVIVLSWAGPVTGMLCALVAGIITQVYLDGSAVKAAANPVLKAASVLIIVGWTTASNMATGCFTSYVLLKRAEDPESEKNETTAAPGVLAGFGMMLRGQLGLVASVAVFFAVVAKLAILIRGIFFSVAEVSATYYWTEVGIILPIILFFQSLSWLVMLKFPDLRHIHLRRRRLPPNPNNPYGIDGHPVYTPRPHLWNAFPERVPVAPPVPVPPPARLGSPPPPPPDGFGLPDFGSPSPYGSPWAPR